MRHRTCQHYTCTAPLECRSAALCPITPALSTAAPLTWRLRLVKACAAEGEPSSPA